MISLRSLVRAANMFMLCASLIFVADVVSSWTGPTLSAPEGNVSAPINVGTSDQVKDGGLSVNSLAVFGNAILSGTTNYLNFGTVAGDTGYGIRNTSGMLEFKNSGGTWEDLATIINNYITIAGNWTVSGSNIYYTAGNVGVGTASPTYPLDVSGSSRVAGELISTLGTGSAQVRMIGGNYGALWRNDGTNTYLLFTNSGDQYGTWNALRPVYFSNTTGDAIFGSSVYASAFLYSSDVRLKKDIETMGRGLSTLLQLRPVSYMWKEGSQAGTKDIGFIAQEVEAVVPEVVHEKVDGYKAVDYPKLIPILVSAIQEQQREIESLKADIDALKVSR